MRTLHRNKTLSKNLDERFYVLDVETTSLLAQPESFVFCCLYGVYSTKFFYSVDEIKNELLKAIYKNKIIFTHFSEFDLNVIYGNIITNLDNGAIYNGSQFICATNGNCKFADSLNIYRTNVKEIGKMLDIQKIETDYKFSKSEITKEQKDYCKRDCEIVFKALSEIFAFVGSVKYTIASLAMALFKTKYLQYDLEYNPNFTDTFMSSYYGGRNEVFKVGKTNAKCIDVNSMYPYCMLQDFPNPKKFKHEKNISIERFLHLLDFYEGHATISVIHKNHFFGYLPIRKDNKLIFPVGKFSGTWNLCEIRNAYEHGVIDILKIEEIFYSTDILKSPFTKYINDLFAIKNSSEGIKKNNAKIFLNGLYGKFAEKPHKNKIYYKEIPIDLLEKYEFLGINYKVYLFNHTRVDCYIEIDEPVKKQNKSHVIPLFSSYITSYARILLLNKMIEYHKDGVIYCDTDSIFIEKINKNFKDSEKIGEFKLENKTIVKINSLKDYIYIENNNIKRKLKGVPQKNSTQISENEYEYDTMIKSKTSLRRNVQTGLHIKVKKTLSLKNDKRINLKDGNTKPIKLKN